MKAHIPVLKWLVIVSLGGLLLPASAQEAPRTVPPTNDQQFSSMAPYGSAAEITRHFGYKVPLPDYDIAKERFRVIVPEAYNTNSAWGLLVWISPGNDAYIPAGWEAEFARQRLLFVSAYNSGNDRHPLDRFRLALDATCNMCRKYRIDRERIFVGGFSGGGRIASMLGVAYADIFAGAVSICGVNFYREVRTPTEERYPPTYTPDPAVWTRAKTLSRFVLVTGENDQNRNNTKYTLENGFKRDNFRNLLYLEVPGMGHEIPNANVLKTTLDFLKGPEKGHLESEAALKPGS